MEILTQVTSAGLLVSLSGVLDGESDEAVRNQLRVVLQLHSKHLLLDFSGVTEVTPSGLRNLLPYVQQAQEKKKELILFQLNEHVRGQMHSCGFDSLVKVVDSLETAMQYAKRGK